MLFCFSVTVRSQTETTASNVARFKMQIENSDGLERLMALDTLCSLIKHKTQFGYEAIARQTIDLAIELDAINVAAKHTMNLILFFGGRIERREDGLKLFNEFSDKIPRVTDSIVLTELYLRGASSYFYSGQTEESFKFYDRAKKIALAYRDSSRYGKAMTYKAFAMSALGQFVDASQEYQKALAVFDSSIDTTNILTAKVGLSILYQKNAFYKESLEEIAFVEEVSLRSERYPEYIMSQVLIGVNHYSSGKYGKAIAPLKEAVRVSEEYPLDAASITETYKYLASAYSKLDSLESAKKIIKKIEAKRQVNSDKFVEMQFLEAQMNLSFAEKNYKSSNNVGQKLLELQLKTSDYEKIVSTLEVLFKANGALGNQSQELYYFKERTRINDSINDIRKLNAFTYYQTLYETEKRDIQIANQSTEIKLLDAKNRVQFQWMLLIAMALLSIGAYFYFISKRNKERAEFEKNKKKLAQQKTKATQLENVLLNKEIEYKKKDLTNFAVEISENQQWAKILLKKFENIKTSSGQYKEDEIEHLGTEIRDKLVIDIESNKFHEKIEKLGSDFYDKLNEKAPKLTKTELRLCSLIRMKISPKQIASLQNITHTSVITSRYRLRKKLLSDPNQDLDNYIINL